MTAKTTTTTGTTCPPWCTRTGCRGAHHAHFNGGHGHPLVSIYPGRDGGPRIVITSRSGRIHVDDLTFAQANNLAGILAGTGADVLAGLLRQAIDALLPADAEDGAA